MLSLPLQQHRQRVADEDILSGLPRAMRLQIDIQMYRSVFVQLPLFWLCQPEEILLIVQRLRACLVMPGEMLVKEGCYGIGLFLLMKGAVETTRDEELPSCCSPPPRSRLRCERLRRRT